MRRNLDYFFWFLRFLVFQLRTSECTSKIFGAEAQLVIKKVDLPHESCSWKVGVVKV